MTDFFAHLRDICRLPHEALHVHPLLQPLHDGPLSLLQYKAALIAFHAAYTNPETEKPPSFFVDNPVVDWLEQDMRALALIPSPVEGLHPILFSSDALLAGYLYVKQGSSLGGKVISRHIFQTLGIGPDSGNRFFSGAGAQTGEQWQRFKTQVSAMELDRDLAAHNALLMFENIRICCDHMLGVLHADTSTIDRRTTKGSA